MEKRNLICATAVLIVGVAGAACSSARGDERGGADGAAGSGETTIAGCLSSSPDGRFALTAAPDAAVSTAARAMDNERDTYTYMLVGGENLQAHLGKRVEVIGTITGKSQEMEQETKAKSTESPAAGGGDTPTVKTKEDVDMTVRQLNVRTVRDLAPTCVVNP